MRLYNRQNENELRKKLRNDMTKAEVILWSQIRNMQIKGIKFRRQYSVGCYIVDFYCPEYRLVIEVDGDSHFQEGVEEYDKIRQQTIESCGISFLRFTNDDVYENLEGVVQRIYWTIDI